MYSTPLRRPLSLCLQCRAKLLRLQHSSASHAESGYDDDVPAGDSQSTHRKPHYPSSRERQYPSQMRPNFRFAERNSRSPSVPAKEFKFMGPSRPRPTEEQPQLSARLRASRASRITAPESQAENSVEEKTVKRVAMVCFSLFFC